MHNQFRLFLTRRFLPLFIVQFFGAFNDNAFKNALLIWLVFYTVMTLADSKQMVNLAAGLFVLPFILFSALAGQVADKLERAQLVRFIKLFEVLLMILTAVSFYFGNIIALMTLLFGMGVHSTFFGPIKYSLLPTHLRADELLGGNGLIEGGTFIAILLGTIFGGIAIGVKYGVFVVSSLLISCALIGYLASFFIPQAQAASPDLRISLSLRSIWQMISEIFENKRLAMTIIAISWFWLFGAILVTQFPIYGKEIGADNRVVTLLLAILTIGIALGSIICHSLLRGRVSTHLLPLSAVGMSIGLFIFIISSYELKDLASAYDVAPLNFIITAPLPLIGLLILAICGGLYSVPLYTLMQKLADKANRSRVIAINNLFNSSFIVTATGITILLFQLGVDLLNLFWILGISNLLIFILVYPHLRDPAKQNDTQE